MRRHHPLARRHAPARHQPGGAGHFGLRFGGRPHGRRLRHGGPLGRRRGRRKDARINRHPEKRRRLGEHRVPRAPRQRRHRACHGQREAHRKRWRAALAALPARLHGQEKGRSAQGAPPARSHPGAFRRLPARVLLQPGHQSGRGPARQRRQASQAGRAVRRRAQS